MPTMPARATRYRQIEVAGTPQAMGHAIGEAAREEIRGFVEVALDRVRLTANVSREKAVRVARESLVFALDYAPCHVEELAATAEAASVSLEDLMLLQIRNQLRAEADAGCTSLSLAPDATAAGHRYVAQNWDNDPELDAFTVVITRRPAGKPALMTVTQAGLIAYIGLNDAGIGLCLNTLPAPARDVGTPHYFLVRGVYESRSLEQAVAKVSRGVRAIPANVMMTTPEGPANLEITLDHVHVLRANGDGRLTHTNHCLHDETTRFNQEFPELIQSHPRLRASNRC